MGHQGHTHSLTPRNSRGGWGVRIQGRRFEEKKIIAAAHDSRAMSNLAVSNESQNSWTLLRVFKGITLVKTFFSVRKMETKQAEGQRRKVQVLLAFSTTLFFLFFFFIFQHEWVFFECDPSALRLLLVYGATECFTFILVLRVLSVGGSLMSKIKWELFNSCNGSIIERPLRIVASPWTALEKTLRSLHLFTEQNAQRSDTKHYCGPSDSVEEKKKNSSSSHLCE